jgi:uncharacterized FlaG/YvyC family protein
VSGDIANAYRCEACGEVSEFLSVPPSAKHARAAKGSKTNEPCGGKWRKVESMKTVETTGETSEAWKTAACASADADADRVESKTYDQECDVKLTDIELLELGREMASALEQRESIKAQKKAADAGYNLQIENLDEQLERVGAKVRAGTDARFVECREDRNFRLGVVRVTRLDTGEVIRDRPMTARERQLTLPSSDEKGNEQAVGDGLDEADDEGGDLEDQLDRAIEDGDALDTAITNPAAMLGDEPKPAKGKRGKGRKS